MTRRERSRKGPPRTDPCEGLLLVDKPADWTSHDVVAKVRNHFRLRKAGHGGTLDPMATGLLVLLIGRGTKLAPYMTGADKEYEGVMLLGRTTDSHDRQGKTLEERPYDTVTREALENETAKFIGEIEQIPPMVSAKKQSGVPLYKLARKGQEVEREARSLRIDRFELKSFDPPHVSFELRCSKGTYVRTLVHDMGEGLGCGACLNDLRRLASGSLRVEDAHTLETVLQHDRQSLRDIMITLDRLDPERLKEGC
ncbi:tRNA pseudouridine(55) synthase TruB [Kiritimatiella glycovorans]|uniref:tRNA pseudouridine synthase B n=1 Tax=Kiritimatiella glycovorans TaxID=1307763 RepID=A0A0G3EDB1_9BACT|nr:tRNA pseudouridine(55) synthase TruB [Kiritimatiella glycovorans]AKJ63352.1 tRNA pseudouridine synthase B [Kiritimatiella glycovorans]